MPKPFFRFYCYTGGLRSLVRVERTRSGEPLGDENDAVAGQMGQGCGAAGEQQ
jgi:hypothetical protein